MGGEIDPSWHCQVHLSVEHSYCFTVGTNTALCFYYSHLHRLFHGKSTEPSQEASERTELQGFEKKFSYLRYFFHLKLTVLTFCFFCPLEKPKNLWNPGWQQRRILLDSLPLSYNTFPSF